MITTLVPKEPTPTMLQAGNAHIFSANNNLIGASADVVYAAMVKVSPDVCEGCRFKRDYATNACIECKRYNNRIDNFEEE